MQQFPIELVAMIFYFSDIETRDSLKIVLLKCSSLFFSETKKTIEETLLFKKSIQTTMPYWYPINLNDRFMDNRKRRHHFSEFSKNIISSSSNNFL